MTQVVKELQLAGDFMPFILIFGPGHFSTADR